MKPPLSSEPIAVALDRLLLDPNNPRLALEEKPGYEDAAALFDPEWQEKLAAQLRDGQHDIDDLVHAVVGQGWMPVDNILVWKHPDEPERYIVVEGNRRRLTLEHIRTTVLERERTKLERMQKRPTTYASEQLAEQERLVGRLQRIVDETATLNVLSVEADNVEELRERLPRVLAVRHITNAKTWGGYAEGLWLLERYNHLAGEQGRAHGGMWQPDVVAQVAAEASLTPAKVKEKLRAASWFSAYKIEYTDRLPEGEEFKQSDYFLFELIARKKWLQEQLGIGEGDRAVPPLGGEALFQWVFKLPRGANKDGDNPNIFYRHENIREWEAMHRYDVKNGTDFAEEFNVEAPEEAPPFVEIEAVWRTHKSRQSSQAAVESMLRRLRQFTGDALKHEGRVLRALLVELRDRSDDYVKMIDAVDG